MSVSLVEPSVAAKWNAIHESGSDKDYPTLEIVRLERWYWGGRPGRVLEYAFGCGQNLIHLLKRGYDVDAIDIAPAAKALVERKLAALALPRHPRLALLPHDAERLPYDDGVFDYVNCLSVLSLLGSRQRVERLLAEFLRVMRPGGKLIADINSPTSDFACESVHAGDGVYLFRGSSGTEAPIPTYCPATAEEFVSLFTGYQVDDVGYAAHKYGPSHIHEFLVCASKPGGER